MPVGGTTPFEEEPEGFGPRRPLSGGFGLQLPEPVRLLSVPTEAELFQPLYGPPIPGGLQQPCQIADIAVYYTKAKQWDPTLGHEETFFIAKLLDQMARESPLIRSVAITSLDRALGMALSEFAAQPRDDDEQLLAQTVGSIKDRMYEGQALAEEIG